MSIGNTGDTSTFGWGKVLSNNNNENLSRLIEKRGDLRGISPLRAVIILSLHFGVSWLT